MNQHLSRAEFKKSAEPDLKLFDIELDLADVTNLLEKIDEFVNGMDLAEEHHQREREGVASVIRATTVLAARALASLEAYRVAHPDPD